MFGRILRALVPARPSAAAEIEAPAAPESDTPERSAGASVSPNPVPARHPAADAATNAETVRRLREEILWRSQALRDSLVISLRTSDAPAVLDALGAEAGTLLRQPPAAARRALELSRDSNTSVRELVRLIESDPGLAQSLLSQANSSYYGTGTRCTSLTEAVQRVGMRGVESVILAAMVAGMLCRPGGDYTSLVNQIWSHMVRTAPIARHLAAVFDVEPEDAYTLGLLHDAGKLVLFDRMAGLRSRWRRELRMPPDIMLCSLKMLHECVGGLAALDWGLGAPAAWAIATHHRVTPTRAEDSLSSVIYLAERIDLADIRGQAPDLEAWWAEGRLSGTPALALGLLEGRDETAA